MQRYTLNLKVVYSSLFYFRLQVYHAPLITPHVEPQTVEYSLLF